MRKASPHLDVARPSEIGGAFRAQSALRRAPWNSQGALPPGGRVPSPDP